MKIKREVNGEMMEFELTTRERFEAYTEEQYLYDRELIEDTFAVNNYPTPPDKVISSLAKTYRELLDDDYYMDDRIMQIRCEVADGIDQYEEAILYPIRQKFQNFKQLTKEELDAYNFFASRNERRNSHDH